MLARAYLADEAGHEDAVTLLDDPGVAPVTGTVARIEVSAALIRAARAGRGDADSLLALLDADLGTGGNVSVLAAPLDQLEERALALVREHGLRTLDAWHLATAAIVVPQVARGRRAAFASRDREQAAVAATLGFELV